MKTSARKLAQERAKEILEKEQNQLRFRLRSNCHDMKRLAKENETHKRELAVLQELIRLLEGGEKE